MNKSKFLVIPWTENYLEHLHGIVDEITGGQPHKAVLVFPNKRPRRYLLNIYRRSGHAVMPPAMLDAGQFTDICLSQWDGAPRQEASLLDRVAILKSCLRKASETAPEGRLQKIAGNLDTPEGMAAFYPWGVRLASLIDECDSHCVRIEANLDYADEDVEKYAGVLLTSLKEISSLYHREMKQRDLTTPGLDKRRAAKLAGRSPEMPGAFRDRTVIFCGFVKLTPAEDRLFRYFWDRGAHVCIHSDPALADGGNGWHWSCADHARWIREWGAKAETETACPHCGAPADAQNLSSMAAAAQDCRYYAGYDLHSQLAKLQENLQGGVHGKNIAVVLAHDGILMPVLHHIPQKNFNISLGYPLKRTLFAQLIGHILDLREKASADGKQIHWKEFLKVIRHPYIGILRPDPKDNRPDPNGNDCPCESGSDFSAALKMIDLAVRQGERMIPADKLTHKDGLKELFFSGKENDGQSGSGNDDSVCLDSLAKLMDGICVQWLHCSTLEELAECLLGLCSRIIREDSGFAEKFPLDMEVIARFMRSSIPALSGSILAKEKLGWSVLAAILRQELESQRIPFEADPIEGLQVLGMLETRLLHFDEVHIVDLTEDAVPGEPVRDPLLPDMLRLYYGLPDNHRREELAAHTFHRLLAGAERIFLYWQEGVQSGLMEKKMPSRFIEERKWEWEKQHGALMDKDPSSPMEKLQFPMFSAAPREVASFPRSDAVNERMLQYLTGTLPAAPRKKPPCPSPSAMDVYLSCPKRFFFNYLCSIKEPASVDEDDNPLEVGTLIHEVLEDTFKKIVNVSSSSKSISVKDAIDLFNSKLAADEKLRNIPAQSQLMLRESGPRRLKTYLESWNGHHTEDTVLCLERTLEAGIDVDGTVCKTMGKADRIDLRGDKLFVLDYKTGKYLPLPAQSLWNTERNQELWDSMRNWEKGSANDPLEELCKKLKSIQLPLYLYMLKNDPSCERFRSRGEVSNAALIELAGSGEEHPLFTEKNALPEEEMLELIEVPIRFILKHMKDAEEFPPAADPARCRICPYTDICGR